MTNKILINNLKHLRMLDMKNMKDVEEMVGVSIGYFSRLEKNEDSFPTVDVVCKLADYFRINVDTLIRYDISDLGQNSRFVLDFLYKIVSDTKAGDISWNLDKRHCIRDYRVYPLDGYLDDVIFIGRENYYACIDSCGNVLIQELYYKTGEEMTFCCYRIALDYKNTGEKDIVITDRCNVAIVNVVFELVQLIKKNVRDIKIDKDVVSMLERYMRE